MKQGSQHQNVNQQRLQRPPLPDCRTCGKEAYWSLCQSQYSLFQVQPERTLCK